MSLPLAGLAVIFDLDGTLIDTADDLAASMNVALGRAGHPPIPASRVRNLVGHGARAMLERGFAENGAPAPSPSEMDAHVAVFLEHYLANIAVRSRPFDGLEAALDEIAGAGAVLCVCTNKQEAWARALLNALGLSGRFVSIVGADTAGRAKPDPAPVRRCLEDAGVSRAIFVGDSDTDIRAAAATGLPCLAVTFGYGPLTLVADDIFSDYSALAPLVRRLYAAAPSATGRRG